MNAKINVLYLSLLPPSSSPCKVLFGLTVRPSVFASAKLTQSSPHLMSIFSRATLYIADYDQPSTLS